MLLFPGDIWLIVPGILLIMSGILGILESRIENRGILKAIKSLETNEINLEELANNLNLEASYLREVILNLRIQGSLQVYLNSTTGNFEKPTEIENHCLYCGEPKLKNSYCLFCGTKLEIDKKKE